MENPKMFDLNTKEDFHFYLQSLILRVNTRMKRHKRYLDEPKDLIDKYKICFEREQSIPAHYYEDMNDKIMNTERTLFNLFGDLTKTAMSYYKWRKTLDKKIIEKEEGFQGLQFLEEEYQSILKDFNELRNWGLHIPESLLVATYERMKKDCHPLPVVMRKNPVIVPYYDQSDARYLLGMYETSVVKHTRMQRLFQRMKKDYSALIGESVRIEAHYPEFAYPFDGCDAEIAEMSWAIQTGKIKKQKNIVKEP